MAVWIQCYAAFVNATTCRIVSRLGRNAWCHLHFARYDLLADLISILCSFSRSGLRPRALFVNTPSGRGGLGEMYGRALLPA